MASPLLSVDGMFDGALTIEGALGHAVVDGHGRLLVPMVDALALMRLSADAEVLLVRFSGGASSALRIPEAVDGADVFVQLEIPEQPGVGTAAWCARLWSYESGPSEAIVSISAMSFASFVGLT